MTQQPSAPPSEPSGGSRSGRPRWVVALVAVLLVGGAALVAVAVFGGGSDGDGGSDELMLDFSGDVGPGTTAPMPDGLGGGWAPIRDGRTPLQGFGEAWVTITAEDGTECEVCLLRAESNDQRARGLMEITDEELGGYDGMLFDFGEEIAGGFWMKNTPLPLSIAWFDGAGALLDTDDMEPCLDPDAVCPAHAPAGVYRWAVEVPQGNLPEVGVTGAATIEVISPRCPPPTT